MRVCTLQIQEAGFDIVTNEERTVTEAEVQLLYQHRAAEVSGAAPRPAPPISFSFSHVKLWADTSLGGNGVL